MYVLDEFYLEYCGQWIGEICNCVAIINRLQTPMKQAKNQNYVHTCYIR